MKLPLKSALVPVVVLVAQHATPLIVRGVQRWLRKQLRQLRGWRPEPWAEWPRQREW